MSKTIILFDRSRAVTDWFCPRKRYLNYELDGIGVVPNREPIELFMGIIIHDSLAEIAKGHSNREFFGADHPGVDIDAIAHSAHLKMYEFLSFDTKLEEDLLYAKEQATLVEGIIRGFYKHCWPRLIQRYPKILAVEQEMSYTYEGMIYMVKPDLVAADEAGEVVYIEYKSTSSKKPEWITSWETAVQLHSTTRAIEASLGEKINHIVVQGLFKGYESYGKQSSPFCYAYKRSGTPPFSQDQIEYEYKAGFRRYATWDLPGGIKGWLEGMPENILANQFPCTPPIFINEDLVEAFFSQRNFREHEIKLFKEILPTIENDEEAVKSLLDASLPQRFDQCSPSWGRPCEYKRICHGAVPEPLENGFKRRTAHHAIEEALQDAKQ